jgi:glycosyltransferase involved in cell wall biosynthesis
VVVAFSDCDHPETKLMLNTLHRISLKLRDSMRYSPVNMESLALLLAIKSRHVSTARRCAELLRAYRLAERPALLANLRERLGPYLDGRASDPGTEIGVAAGRDAGVLARSCVDRSIVLKAPGEDGEKGVILVMLEPNWLRLFAGCNDLEILDDRFTFVLSTGWSSTDYSLVALAVRSLRSTVFIQACNYGEISKLEAFSPRVRCLPTIACDWISPWFYEPKPFHQREIDFLMVANWAPFKRHWHFFAGLARMPKNLRVAMIGQPDGPHTLESVREQARLFGVKQEIEFKESLPIEVVQKYQCNSKVSVILSRREGCCVAVVESLFADSPVALLKDAHVGPRAYINDQTGVLLEHSRLDRQLSPFLERADRCGARDWAIDNISCFQSIGKLNTLLRDNAVASGRPWTSDLKIPCWRPYPIYVNPEDAEDMRTTYEWLHRRFPTVFSSQLIESVVKTPPRTVVSQ